MRVDPSLDVIFFRAAIRADDDGATGAVLRDSRNDLGVA